MALKIRKTVIKSRFSEQARTVDNILELSKNLTATKRKEEEVLFNAYITERQSMRKAHAFNKWKNFVIKNQY